MKVFKSCGLSVLALIILLVLSIAITFWVFSRRYNAGLTALRAKGEPMTLADMQKDPVPDKENAALIYLSVINDLKSPRYSSYAEILDGFSPRKIGSDPKAWQDVGDAVKATAPLFADIERAASMPKCRFPQNWSSMAPMPVPQWAGSRRLARICRARAVLSARRGDMSDAVRMVELQFRISESLYDEPLILGFLVRGATAAVASQTLRDISAYGRLPELDAEDLYHLLAQIDPNKGYARSLRGERAFYLRTWDSMVAYTSGGSASGRTAGGILMYPDRAVYLSAVQNEISRVDMSYRDAKSKGLLDPGKRLPMYAFTTKIVLPTYTGGKCVRDLLIAEIRGSQAFLAAIAYADRCGAYPQSLAEAQTKLGWKLKDDPFSGKPFIYKRKGGGFLLYSIGEDLVDNGGTHGKSYREPDIVWEMAR